jgi:hypothetical protein
MNQSPKTETTNPATTHHFVRRNSSPAVSHTMAAHDNETPARQKNP